MIVAKWTSFLRHVANRHKAHPDALFKNCSHGKLKPRKWIKIGTAAYQKLSSILSKKMLLNDIKNLSSEAQTSCLEGFHATLNHWHPKMICFSWLGTYCRHALAVLHFNENLQREPQLSKSGEKYVKVCFPKNKVGDEVVRDVKVAPTYGYVSEILKVAQNLSKQKRSAIFKKYQAIAPGSLTEQFTTRKSKSEAVREKENRMQKPNTLYPSETKQLEMQKAEQEKKKKTSKGGNKVKINKKTTK